MELARGGAGEDEPGYEKLIWEAVATGHLAATGAEKIYEVNLPAPATVALDGPGGVDFDLYVKKNAPPTTTSYDQRAYTSGSDETLRLTPDSSGRYYILVRSYRGSGEFSLRVTLE